MVFQLRIKKTHITMLILKTLNDDNEEMEQKALKIDVYTISMTHQARVYLALLGILRICSTNFGLLLQWKSQPIRFRESPKPQNPKSMKYIKFNLIYIVILITFIIFLMKNLALVFNLWNQENFLRKIKFELTKRLFNYYLKNNYI